MLNNDKKILLNVGIKKTNMSFQTYFILNNLGRVGSPLEGSLIRIKVHTVNLCFIYIYIYLMLYSSIKAVLTNIK